MQEPFAPNFSLHVGSGDESESCSSDDDAVPGNGDSSDDETLNQIAARLSATGSPQSEYTEWGHESVNMEDIDSSEDETLTQLGLTRSKGGMRTRGAAFSKGENLSVDDTDEYGEDESDDDESSDGGSSKTEPPAARSRAGAIMAKQPVERLCNSATEQPHKYKSIIVNGQQRGNITA